MSRTTKPTLGVAMVGYGFMGAAHSPGLARRSAVLRSAAEPEMPTIVGRDAERVEAAAGEVRLAAAPRPTGAG